MLKEGISHAERDIVTIIGHDGVKSPGGTERVDSLGLEFRGHFLIGRCFFSWWT